MDILVLIFAVVGALVFLFWLVSLFAGVFGPKARIGVNFLKKRLRQLNIDPDLVGHDVLLEFSSNALSVATWSGRTIGKYDAAEFREQLEWRAELIRAWVRQEKLDKDSEQLIMMMVDKAKSKQDRLL